jgi:hypothetical protein
MDRKLWIVPFYFLVLRQFLAENWSAFVAAYEGFSGEEEAKYVFALLSGTVSDEVNDEH